MVVIESFLSKTECQHYKDLIDLVFLSPEVMIEQMSDGRLIIPELQNRIMASNNNITLCNNQFYFNRMRVGRNMNVHVDQAEEFYNATCLIYLNEEFEGGDTEFYKDYLGREEPFDIVKAKTGKMIIFDINIPHAVSKVLSIKNNENYRYTIITDIRIG